MRTWLVSIVLGVVIVAAAIVVAMPRSQPTLAPEPHVGLSLPATAELDPARLHLVPVGRAVDVVNVQAPRVRVAAVRRVDRKDRWGERWSDLVAVRITISDTDVLGYTGAMGDCLVLYDREGETYYQQVLGLRGELDHVQIEPASGVVCTGWVYFPMPADRWPAVLVYRTRPSYGTPYGAWRLE